MNIKKDPQFYSRIYATMVNHDLEYNNFAGNQAGTPFNNQNFNIIEHNIIALLNTLKETTMSDLAKRLAMLPPNLSPIVKSLEKRGLIVRKHKDGDKRYVFISLSELGEELVKMQSRALIERLEHVLKSALTDAEQVDFAEIYERLVTYFKKMNEIEKKSKENRN